MAEEDFDLDDDLTDDFEEDFEEAAPAISAPEKTSFFTRKRIIVISVLTVVILIGAGLAFMSFKGANKKPKTNASGITTVQAEAAKEKEATLKKKRKKIKYKELFSQLEPEQTTKILKELTFAGLSYTTEQQGKKFTVLIDEDELVEARNLLAIKGLPSGSIKGYELLDAGATLGVTEFDKRVRFLRALSGELEKAILQFEMIENAKVQIVLPEQRLFAVTQPPVTSSILIRRKGNADITDGIVFSIIQLVANAVENLQPENVSIIDTQGKVLSQGIFERIAAREAGEVLEEVKADPVKQDDIVLKEDATGNPIIPNYESIDQWFEMKWSFEKELEVKATKQLMGILPLGAYKVSVASDLGPIEQGNSIDVKRLTISVVVDGTNEDIYLDADTKTQIFSTVAGAVGYIRGRDSIQLSRADFTLFTPEELKEIQKLRPRSYTWVKYVGAFLAVVSIFGLGYVGIRNLRRRRLASKDKDILSSKPRDTDFSSLQNEMKDEKTTDKLRALVNDEPELIAQIMEKWLNISDTAKEKSNEYEEVG